jgi:hypothetical protein
MAPRAKNEATTRELRKVLLGSGLKSVALMQTTDLQDVVLAHKDLLIDLLRVTPRLQRGLLGTAIQEVVTTSSPEEARLFAAQLCEAARLCRRKAGNAVTGERLPSPVRAVARALLEARPWVRGRLGSSLLTKARTLHRQASEEAAKGQSRLLPQEAAAASLGGKPVSTAALGAAPGRLSREEIFALHGLAPGGAGLRPAAEGPVDLLTSEEEEVACLSGAASSGPAAAAAQALAAHAPAAHAEYLDSVRCRLVRAFPDGRIVEASMLPGPAGFAMATFPGESPRATELPNLLLLPIRPALKRPAARRVSAQPAAARSHAGARQEHGPSEEDPQEEGEEEPQAPEQALLPHVPVVAEEEGLEAPAGPSPPGCRSYGRMWYKAVAAVAVRQRGGQKRQVFQLRGGGRTRQELEALADTCITKLEAGEWSEQQAKEWGQAQLR